MPTGTVTQTISVAGISIAGTSSRTETGEIAHELNLPAGTAGTLSTRTNDTSGVLTLGEGHGVTVDDFVDVYWTGGVRYGMDVTAVNGNDVTVDGTTAGGGDVLPDVDSEIVATPRVTIDTDFDGDLAEILAAVSTKRSHLEFRENDGTLVKAVELLAGEPWAWAKNIGYTNPLAGEPVGKIDASCGETAAATLKIAVLYDSA